MYLFIPIDLDSRNCICIYIYLLLPFSVVRCNGDWLFVIMSEVMFKECKSIANILWSKTCYFEIVLL